MDGGEAASFTDKIVKVTECDDGEKVKENGVEIAKDAVEGDDDDDDEEREIVALIRESNVRFGDSKLQYASRSAHANLSQLLTKAPTNISAKENAIGEEADEDASDSDEEFYIHSALLPLRKSASLAANISSTHAHSTPFRPAVPTKLEMISSAHCCEEKVLPETGETVNPLVPNYDSNRHRQAMNNPDFIEEQPASEGCFEAYTIFNSSQSNNHDESSSSLKKEESALASAVCETSVNHPFINGSYSSAVKRDRGEPDVESSIRETRMCPLIRQFQANAITPPIERIAPSLLQSMFGTDDDAEDEFEQRVSYKRQRMEESDDDLRTRNGNRGRSSVASDDDENLESEEADAMGERGDEDYASISSALSIASAALNGACWSAPAGCSDYDEEEEEEEVDMDILRSGGVNQMYSFKSGAVGKSDSLAHNNRLNRCTTMQDDDEDEEDENGSSEDGDDDQRALLRMASGGDCSRPASRQRAKFARKRKTDDAEAIEAVVAELHREFCDTLRPQRCESSWSSPSRLENHSDSENARRMSKRRLKKAKGRDGSGKSERRKEKGNEEMHDVREQNVNCPASLNEQSYAKEKFSNCKTTATGMIEEDASPPMVMVEETVPGDGVLDKNALSADEDLTATEGAKFDVSERNIDDKKEIEVITTTTELDGEDYQPKNLQTQNRTFENQSSELDGLTPELGEPRLDAADGIVSRVDEEEPERMSTSSETCSDEEEDGDSSTSSLTASPSPKLTVLNFRSSAIEHRRVQPPQSLGFQRSSTSTFPTQSSSTLSGKFVNGGGCLPMPSSQSESHLMFGQQRFGIEFFRNLQQPVLTSHQAVEEAKVEREASIGPPPSRCRMFPHSLTYDGAGQFDTENKVQPGHHVIFRRNSGHFPQHRRSSGSVMPSAESAMFIGGNRRSWYNRHVLTVDGGLSQLAETVQEATASSIMNTDTTKKWPNVDTEKGCSSVEPENIRLEATDDDRSRKTKNLTPVDELIRFWATCPTGRRINRSPPHPIDLTMDSASVMARRKRSCMSLDENAFGGGVEIPLADDDAVLSPAFSEDGGDRSRHRYHHRYRRSPPIASEDELSESELSEMEIRVARGDFAVTAGDLNVVARMEVLEPMMFDDEEEEEDDDDFATPRAIQLESALSAAVVGENMINDSLPDSKPYPLLTEDVHGNGNETESFEKELEYRFGGTIAESSSMPSLLAGGANRNDGRVDFNQLTMAADFTCYHAAADDAFTHHYHLPAASCSTRQALEFPVEYDPRMRMTRSVTTGAEYDGEQRPYGTIVSSLSMLPFSSLLRHQFRAAGAQTHRTALDNNAAQLHPAPAFARRILPLRPDEISASCCANSEGPAQPQHTSRLICQQQHRCPPQSRPEVSAIGKSTGRRLPQIPVFTGPTTVPTRFNASASSGGGLPSRQIGSSSLPAASSVAAEELLDVLLPPPLLHDDNFLEVKSAVESGADLSPVSELLLESLKLQMTTAQDAVNNDVNTGGDKRREEVGNRQYGDAAAAEKADLEEDVVINKFPDAIAAAFSTLHQHRTAQQQKAASIVERQRYPLTERPPEREEYQFSYGMDASLTTMMRSESVGDLFCGGRRRLLEDSYYEDDTGFSTTTTTAGAVLGRKDEPARRTGDADAASGFDESKKKDSGYNLTDENSSGFSSCCTSSSTAAFDPATTTTVPTTTVAVNGRRRSRRSIAAATTDLAERPTHRAQFVFSPRHDDEILLEVGDALRVDRISDDHWCYGTNLRTGRSGIFPSAHICEIDLVEEICQGALADSTTVATATCPINGIAVPFRYPLQQQHRDTFYLTMLASVEVAHHKGNDVLVQAINKVCSMYQQKEEVLVPQTVLVEISFRGIHVIDKRKKDIFRCPTFDFFYSLQNISFCGAHPKQLRYFGFITKHPLLPRFACHVFLSQESTQPIVEAIGHAFKRSYDEYMAFAHPTEDIYIE